MIVTVTMNPALDKTAHLTQLAPRALNRLEQVRVDAGGKGVNVSRMIAALGGHSVCTGFIGGDSGREVCRRLDADGISHAFLAVEGATRTNLKIIEADGALTELNEPGFTVTEQDLAALRSRVKQLAGQNGIVVLAGSLPRGAQTDTYRDFACALRRAGCRVIVDADGAALRAALQAPPHIIKPNRMELLQYFGLPQDTPDARLPALCRELLAQGVELVILSRGAQGALFVARDAAWQADACATAVRSAVGAGDSMVGAAAFALERGYDLEATARLTMASSGGAVMTEGTNPPSCETVLALMDHVELRPL